MTDARLYRRLPAVDRLLDQEVMAPVVAEFGLAATTDALRALLDALRNQIAQKTLSEVPQAATLAQQAAELLRRRSQNSLRPVFNLTGVVLHTNLGRARLPQVAAEAVQQVATQASNLEYDLDAGARGNRDEHIAKLVCQLTGAEAATVVNNNAAAVLLCLNTLALGREVCVSRGELVEIGGSFRIPDIMARSGTKLLEVGTTNRTHLKDYASALEGANQVAALMKVHTSNYEIRGFTAEVTYKALATLAHQHDLPLLVDLGSGALVDLKRYGLAEEPTVAEVLEEGADLVTFSGDKLLGGPQAGIIAGKRDLIAAVQGNPMKRALRADKMTLAALAALLGLYLKPETLARDLPTLKDLTKPVEDISQLAQELLPLVSQCLGKLAKVEQVDCQSQIGSGALPSHSLPSSGLAITPLDGREATLQAVTEALRSLPLPVIGRFQDGSLILDCRTLADPQGFAANLKALALP